MEVRAHLRHLRLAPRKVRLVVDLVRGMPVDQAVDQLTILPKASSLPVLKLLNSAIANAEHNFKLDRKTLHIKSIVANEGPRLKRYRPRAFGRAAEILKRSSHITIVLEDSGHSAPPAKTKQRVTTVDVPVTDIKKATPEPKMPASMKSNTGASRTAAHQAQDKTIHRQGKD